MAFLQRPQAVRQLSFSTPAPPAEAAAVSSPQRKRTLEESEEWILFSPAAPSVTNTQTTSTERTPRTAGLSRLSDFGSLDTAARSDQIGQEDDGDDDVTCQGTDPEEDGTELDSLDDGLHAFHEPSEPGSVAQRLDHSGGTVLPTHDGLGTFPASSALVQEQLYQFERYNPRRRHRRRSSAQRRLDALGEAEELVEQDERMERIEKWRLEQSRALLEEIERETRRRRRMSRVSATRSRTDSVVQHDRPTITLAQEARESTNEVVENETFWQRLTRRVIRDLMGIDENLLSVILGETLPPEELQSTASASAPHGQEQQDRGNNYLNTPTPQTWEHRLLERIARELGILVHQLSEHPGAFSTYLQTQETPAYAGLPTSIARPSSVSTDPTSSTLPSESRPSPNDTLFAPTLPNQTSASYNEASLWGIEEEPEAQGTQNIRHNSNNNAQTRQDREYWERELDVKMVFSFLLKRFSTRTPPSAPTQPDVLAASTSSTPAAPSPLAARRAALIRQHHPLLNRSGTEQSRRRDLLHRHHLHHQHQPSLMRSRLSANRAGSSSCASQSTKKSKRSGSSRNYWDIGGSVGSGPALSAGVWGEI